MRFTLFLVFCALGFSARSQWSIAFNGPDTDNEVNNSFFLTPSTGYIATDKWIGFTTDSGHTFQRRYVTISNVDFNFNPVNLLFGFTAEDVHAFSIDTIVVSGDFGLEPSILYSTNGGITWKVVFHRTIPLTTINLVNSMWKMEWPGNGSTGFGIHGDQIVRSTNRGQTWQAIVTDPNQELNDLAFGNTLVGYGSGPNRLWKTVNGGANWSLVNTSFSIRTISAYGNYVFAITGNDDSYYSSNQGASWTLANSAVGKQRLDDIRYLNDSTGFGALGGIYKTTNRGKTWELTEGVLQGGYSYFVNKLFFLNDQIGWGAAPDEDLFITTNGGGRVFPRALFDVNIATVCTDDTVRLVNQGSLQNSYQWFRNDILFATTYNAKYKIGAGNDIIKLVSTNALATDTMIKVVDAAVVAALTLNSVARRDTICSGGVAYIDILNSRPDVIYTVSRPCCGSTGGTNGNGSTLTFAMGLAPTEDTSTTFFVSATLTSPCGTQTANAQHRIHPVKTNPPATVISDTICTQNSFYIKIADSKVGYQYWADPSFPKVSGNGGMIQLPCNVGMATSVAPIDDLITRYSFEVFAQEARFGCGGNRPVGNGYIYGRNSKPIFEIGGYDWFTNTNLLFQNTSRQSQTYLWKFPDGGNNPTSTDIIPNNIQYTTAGYKTVRLLATTKEGCVDSASRVIELINSTGTPPTETICNGSLPGNALDTLSGRQYYVNRALLEDQYGNRIVAGGYTDMTFMNQFFPAGYEGWYAAKFDKNGNLLWRLQQKAGDEETYDRNTHIVAENAVADSFGYTYILGHSKGRSALTANGQEKFSLPAGCMFILKVSPTGKIVCVKTFSSGDGINYTGGTLLLGRNNSLYIVTGKMPNYAYAMNGVVLYLSYEGLSGIILQLDRNGEIMRKRTFPITYNNLRRYSIYQSNNYDSLPPASWDASGNLVVCGRLSATEMQGNSIDGIVIPFNTANIQSALIAFDTASLQCVSVKPIYKIVNGTQIGVKCESYAIGSNGQYFASYSEHVPFPAPYEGSPYDTLKAKSFIYAYGSTGNLLWSKQAEGLQPKRMVITNDQLRIAASNYPLRDYVNGAATGVFNQSPTFSWVRKLTALSDIGTFDGKGNYGLGSFDLTIASLATVDGDLIKLTQLGTTEEDAYMSMVKGYGDQLLISGTVGIRARYGTSLNDTTTTLAVYKMPIGTNCVTTFQSQPRFLSLDLRRNDKYCVDSILRIYWSSELISQVNLSYSINGGASYTPIATAIAAKPGLFDFNINNAGISGNLQIKVEAVGAPFVDTVSLIIYSNVNPAVSITTPSTTICSGVTTTITASPVNGGPNPTYLWSRNNSAIIHSGPVYSGVFLNNETVQVRITSNSLCVTTPSAVSNVIRFTVNATIAPTITLAGNAIVNQGQVTQISTTITNGGSSPVFEWEDSTQSHSWARINNAANSTLAYQPAATGDRVRCKLTSSSNCANPSVVTSKAFIFTVNIPTAINPVSGSYFGIRLYPNPVLEMFAIDTLNLSDKWTALDIISMDGKQVIQNYDIRNKSQVKINVTMLKAGVYFAILRRNSGSPVYLRLVKL